MSLINPDGVVNDICFSSSSMLEVWIREMFCWLLPIRTMNLCSFHQQSITSLPEGITFIYSAYRLGMQMVLEMLESKSFIGLLKSLRKKLTEVQQVPVQQVTVMDHPEFQDGFGKVWNSSILSKIVEEKVRAHEIDMILTFDNYGVSGHCNHRDVNHGVRRFMLGTSQQEIETWELVSINIIRKYSGPIDIWFSLWSSRNSSNGQIKCLLNDNPSRSYVGMSQHLSQWVWFRKLFVSFSSYTYVNTLRKINK